MKHLKHLLTALLLLCSSVVCAHDFEVDGIYYKKNYGGENQVTVTYKGDDWYNNDYTYTGSIVIPKTVSYNGVTYTVTSIGQYAFYYCSNLTSIYIPNSVNYIGLYAFKNCYKLEAVYIDDLEAWCNISFPYIDRDEDSTNDSNPLYYAKRLYLNGKELTELVIPSSITKINNYAFYGCSSIKSVKIHNNVTEIGSSAFELCSDLNSINLPSIDYLYSYTFSGCVSLESIKIPTSVTGISSNAFEGCSNLKSINIPSSVTYIGSEAFYGCSELNNIIIPNSVTYIREGTFAYSGLNTITIHNGVEYIDDDAFAHTPLISISIPQSTISIGEGVFTGCNKVETILVDKNNTEYDSRDNCNAIIETATNKLIFGCKSTIIPNSVTSIGEEAFEGCWELKNIIIPNSVIDIGYDAFRECKGLINICIPNSVTTIRRNAFDSCENLESVFIGANITNIGSDVFINCSNLAKIEVDKGNVIYDSRDNCNAIIKTATNALVFGCKSTIIPNTVNSIENSAFKGCTGLESIVIPNGVTGLGYYAFRNCTGLKSIVIPNSVTGIGSYAFDGCTALEKVDLNCSTIKRDWFSGNTTIKNVVFGDNVTSIEYGAFNGCSNLTDIVIPNSITSIGNYAFQDCTSLTSIAVGSGNPVYDSRDNCNAIIKTATNTLIQGCENTIIPSSVTSIGESAFYNCLGITYIVIPYNVASVKWRAFSGCSNLKDIEFNSNPLIDTNAIPSTAKCHLMLNDNNVADFNTANTNTFADVSYTRTISEGKYGTIILPFAPDAASIENYAFYELVESGEGYMKFDEVAQPIANTPYIYTLREGKENVAIIGGETTISSNIETPVVDGWQTIGSFTNQALDTSDGNYYAFSPSKNEINKITKNLTVLPYRAYFKSDNASKSAFSVYISRTTGVKEVLSSEIDGFETEVVYDLSGRKILDPVRGGIYIINGKKVKF